MTSSTEHTARLRACGVVPVVTIPSAGAAVPLARALVAGGLDVIEVTLRTDAALDAIAEISRANIGLLVGAGTVLRPEDVDSARQAGADFLVTPGTPGHLVGALRAFHGLVIPGVATVTEALDRQEDGFDILKFFPAEAAGGAPFLKSIQAPLPNVEFMPTGGVSPDNLRDYLGLANVVSAGGSWVAPVNLIAAEDWTEIETRARAAADLARDIRNGP